jgi:hypothetical protein
VTKLLAVLAVPALLWGLRPISGGPTVVRADELAATKQLSDLGKAADTYRIDNKQWPMANGAAFWVVLYQNQYVAKMSMFISATSGDDNSTLAWPIGKTAPIPAIAPGDVSFAGPRDWRALPLGAANDSLMGSDDSEGPAHFDDGMATVERNGRAKYLTWSEIKPGAVEGILGEVKVGAVGTRLVDLIN